MNQSPSIMKNYDTEKFSKKSPLKGFTLIEIMAVMAIIAVLAAMSISGLSYYNNKKNVSRTTVLIKSIESALEGYRRDNGNYPNSLADFDDVDAWGASLEYRHPGVNNPADDFDLWSLGPDGVSGTGDDIKNW